MTSFTEKQSKEEEKPSDVFHDEGEIDPALSQKIEVRWHKWKQQGPYIVCKSCEMPHTAWVGIDKMLIGIDDNGMPIFTTRFQDD